MPDSVCDLKQTLIFKRCMVECESKNGHLKDMCWKEIELHAQNLLAILDIIVNIIDGTCMIIY